MESTSQNVAITYSGTKMEAESNTNTKVTEAVFDGKQNIDALADKTVDSSDMNRTVKNFLDQGGTSQLKSIANEGQQDPDLQKKLVEICELFVSYYDKHKSTLNEKKLEGDNAKLTETFNKYKNNLELVNHFSNWKKARKELIEVSKSTAERLDQQFFIVNIARMIGSLVEILNAMNSGIYQNFCSFMKSYAYAKHPKLGFITESALQLAPYLNHLRFMGFASSFFDILESQVVIKRVRNVIKNDEEMFEPVKEWIDEIKELFPYQINKEIIKSIDDTLGELGEEQKLFSAAILSNIMKDPMIHKDKKFMTNAIRFCGSDAARGLYKRMKDGACPSELDRDLMNLREELRKWEEADAEIASAVENSKGVVETVGNATKINERSDFGRFASFMISGISIYWSLGYIRAGSRHRYSDRLRKLSRNAQSFLNKMEQIGFPNE